MLVQARDSFAVIGAAAATCDSIGGNMRVADVMGSAQSRQQQRCQQKAAQQPAAQALLGQCAGKPDSMVALVGQGKQPATGTAGSTYGTSVPHAPRQQAAKQQVSCRVADPFVRQPGARSA
jgi:hypothetical protein